VGWRAAAVVVGHIPSVICAGIGWWALLDRDSRPGMAKAAELRWIKESINALLPVVQVGGDVVRAQLAVSRQLPLAMSAASCVIDAGAGIVGLVIFDLTGIAAALWRFDDARLSRIAVALISAALLVAVALGLAERMGALRLVERAVRRTKGVFGELAQVGDRLRE